MCFYNGSFFCIVFICEFPDNAGLIAEGSEREKKNKKTPPSALLLSCKEKGRIRLRKLV